MATGVITTQNEELCYHLGKDVGVAPSNHLGLHTVLFAVAMWDLFLGNFIGHIQFRAANIDSLDPYSQLKRNMSTLLTIVEFCKYLAEMKKIPISCMET